MPKQVLIVCTGNTCRSPMAEVLLRAALPPDSDWVVTSAGTSADPGSAASEFSRIAIAECGLNLDNHRSQLVTQELVDESMVIVAMTNRHVEKLLQRVPSARDRIYLMRSFDTKAPTGSDVFDPYCGTLAEYRACRDMIQQAMQGLVHFLTHQSE
jgi:protein-tyrosine phosphatase